MIETIHRIRFPELYSGARTSLAMQPSSEVQHLPCYPRISSEFSVSRDGVLYSSIKKPQRTLFVRWRSDATTGRLTAHWESGEEPGSRFHYAPHLVALHKQCAM